MAMLVGAIAAIVVVAIIFVVAASTIGHNDKTNTKPPSPVSTTLPAGATTPASGP